MIPRKHYIDRIRPFIDKDIVKVLTGFRRSGKSVMLELIQQELRAQGVQAAQIIAFNFESFSNAAYLTAAALYEELVEGSTGAPTFYTDFPVETSPLTRRHRGDPRLAERWDLVAFGMELGTAYTELTDPIDQRQRLTEQSLRAAAGDPEAMEVDEEFLSALEFGMPPTGGLGLGIDRIAMFLLGASIRETLAFPFVRPEARPAN